DVTTCWNYTHAMIRRAQLLQEAIDEWVFDPSHKDLRELNLSPADWKKLEQLETILNVFTEVTLQMSRTDTPTLPWVLPMYCRMEKHLTTVANSDLPCSFHEAARAGLAKLDTYHKLAKGNQFCVVATG
ncbi:hypothetical protein BT96DRAFT_745905, partial [Gymnopus androsaceus JB14]